MRFWLLPFICFAPSFAAADPLPNTQPLTMEGDIASQLVDGVDRFLLWQIEKATEHRQTHWKRDPSSKEAYVRSIEPNQERLRKILGLRDKRHKVTSIEIVSTTQDSSRVIGDGEHFKVYAVRWPVFADVHGEGLLLVPNEHGLIASAIVVPDCDQTPEQLVGLAEGIPAESQIARRLAENGETVVIPRLINRVQGQVKVEGFRGLGLANREFIHRSAFELGRTLTGYEIQKILALVHWISDAANTDTGESVRVGVFGYGEGGRMALLAGAVDPAIKCICVSGYFGSRQRMWDEPLDRNVFGLLNEFGDAELAAMIAPRKLIIEACRAPEKEFTGKGGGAPARIKTPPLEEVRQEFTRAAGFVRKLNPHFDLVVSNQGTGPFGCEETLQKLLAAIGPGGERTVQPIGGPPRDHRKEPPLEAMHYGQLQEFDRYNQRLLADCDKVRAEFMSKLDTSSPARFAETRETYRNIFYDEVIGRFNEPMLPINPRTRMVEENSQWTRYEVVLDVFPDVIAYGLLTIPTNIPAGQKRPVVVCQHGLEGRPQDTIGETGSQYYSAFATKLAERGYITLAPQNLYIFHDRFRTLQRKANTIGKTLFSVIVPQHQQMTDWLKSLPQVDGQRIAFYGLSYGGKSAMRIPPLVENYCLSLCSGDFNEWVLKNVSTRHSFSYVWTTEYEIFEFDLANTFNYAEMAMLIAPRPFMVERGHHDGVAEDEWVAHEYAKIYRFYATRLRQPERCEIEWFDGPHKINGVGAFQFLDKHLR